MKKDTLVIIGNGFDMWQNLNTSYHDFRKYYLSHRNEILKRLRIKNKLVKKIYGESCNFTDVELIYGNPFDICDLDYDFWNSFEISLDKLDAEQLNLFFGKEKKELKQMYKSIKNANRILSEAFSNWISTITTDNVDSGFRFKENCFFINFNYTSTLEKRFGVDEGDVFHIHGNAEDPESIIFGHASHPQEPEPFLYKLGGRFRGLFLIETLLYQTDKHVRDNISLLCMAMALSGISAENIKDIYVLGHSLGSVDFEYFAFLKKITSLNREDEAKEDFAYNELDSLDELNNRMQYAIKRYGHDHTIYEPISSEEEASVQRKLFWEQQSRDKSLYRYFFKLLKKTTRTPFKFFHPTSCVSSDIKDFVHKSRTEDAMWHISYHSSEDKERASRLMGTLECNNYDLFPSINEAIKKITEPITK